eukprot:SAG31_NODE_1760_length_7322_cov_2.480011_2_plen_139_part_00
MPSMPCQQGARGGSCQVARAQRGSNAHLGQSLGSAHANHRAEGTGVREELEMVELMECLQMLVDEAKETAGQWSRRLEAATGQGADLEVKSTILPLIIYSDIFNVSESCNIGSKSVWGWDDEPGWGSARPKCSSTAHN